MNHQNWTSRRWSRRGLIRGGVLGGAGLAGVALVGCGSDDEPAPGTTTPPPSGATPSATADPSEPRQGGVYRTSRQGDPPTIDPYRNNSFETMYAASFVYSRLYRVGAEPGVPGTGAPPVPDLAESAETEDGQHWVVRLKPDVRFHNVAPLDGRTLTADDVVFSYEKATAETALQRDRISPITAVEAVDDTTLNFTLARPSATFLDLLADSSVFWVVPQESDGGFNPAERMIGTGPFILGDYRVEQSFRYLRNPDWFDEGPYVDEVQVSIIPEYANRLAQFQAGNLDELGVTADQVLDLRSSQPEVQWTGALGASNAIVFFSGAHREPNAPWQDPRFRQAVSMSINRAGLTQAFYQTEELAAAGLDVSRAWHNLVPVGFGEWWLDPQSADQGESGRWFNHDPDEARKLLDAMGAAGAEFKWQYTGNRYGAIFNSMAEATTGFLTDIGLRPATDVQDYNSVYLTRTYVGDFDGVGMGVRSKSEVGQFFESLFGDDPTNHSRLDDPRMNELRALAEVELDHDRRVEYLHEMQRYNAEEMFYVPHQWGAGLSWTAWAPHVRGARDTRGFALGVEVIAPLWLDV